MPTQHPAEFLRALLDTSAEGRVDKQSDISMKIGERA
jgi:hypothetical protein